jgi:ATP-dependent helicase HrpB
VIDAAAPSLPIDAVLPVLRTKLAASPRAVLVAEPGAGKTTRVPLTLLDEPWARLGKIIVLEPRRLAARAAADQMARLVGEEVGGTIGYRVRFDTQVSARTRIEIVTEGVFTRLILDDPGLTGVAAVLFDEFHERSLDGDLGLALALDAQAGLREDLRLLVMSATLDHARVAKLMGDAPIIACAGRSFPVETRYRPRAAATRVEDAMAEAVRAALRGEEGSLLAFLPGAAEIERTAEQLRRDLSDTVDVVPLYGALDRGVQDRAIRPAPKGRRKVVLATAIAESSLTIEGVRVVIDSGLARVPRFDPATALTRLETVRVSRASADQRRGRAGRLEPGICIRLWEEGQTRALAPFASPEILEADLAPLVLDCAAFGVRDPAALPFLDPPPAPALAEARALLEGLEAIDHDGRITEEGKTLARLPLHPRLAHMLHRAAARGEGVLAAEIAIVLSEHGLGGTDTDLEHRLRLLRADRSPRARDARRLAARWAALVGAGGGDGDVTRAGAVLMSAYPDRIAKARPGKTGEVVLANGRGAALDPADPLARAPYLVVAALAGAQARGRVLLAARVSEADILANAGAMIVESENVVFDKAALAVRARRIRRLGAIVLSEAPIAVPSDKGTVVLLDGLRDQALLDALPWTTGSRQLVERVRFLRAAAPDIWPDMSEEALRRRLPDWLGPFIPGITAVADITPQQIAAALEAWLGPLRRRVDAEAPTHFEAPTGSRLMIAYDRDRGPMVAIRVQELFGLDQHPMIANGRIPLTFDLLSPAHRPIQTTRDLPGFWRGSWGDVRADMRGRYPKHPWPEDPRLAQPTTRAKPRVRS